MFEIKPTSVFEPALSSWPSIVSKPPEEILELRSSVIDAAKQFSQQIKQVASSVGIQFEEISAAGPDQPIVMAGHQPVIYHPGLSAKTQALSTYASNYPVTTINVIIDHDIGSAGEIKFPLKDYSGLILTSAEIQSNQKLFKNQTVGPVPQIEENFGRIISGFKSINRTDLIERCEKIAAIYKGLSGQPISIANSVARAMFETKRYYLEVPLSNLLALPSIKKIISEWTNQGAVLSKLYNSALDSHRLLRKIKNPANPFPNLKTAGNGIELPFWLVDYSKDIRDMAWVRDGNLMAQIDPESDLQSIQTFPNFTVTPRGAMITLLLRGYCCDLFVHGLGGKTYDTFTTSFGADLLNRPISNIAIVSASTYLFPNELEAYEKVSNFESKIKEIVSKTKDYLTPAFFNAEQISLLKPLVEKRENTVKTLADTKDPETQRELGKTLRSINEEIRSLAASRLSELKTNIPKVDNATLEAWYCREYPAFFF